MTMIQTHSDALDSSSPAFHEFLLYYKSTDKTVYGFVEGKEDPSFYRGMIENSLPEGWTIKLIQAGNKNNLYKLQAEMNWQRFSEHRICFFTDRDFSEFITTKMPVVKNVYVTDNYSIENEVVKFVALERVLEEVLNVTGLQPAEITKIRGLFEINLVLFSDAMVPIMCQIILWQRDGKRPSLDNIRPKDLFSFIDGVIATKAGFSTPESRVLHASSRCGLSCSSHDELIKVDKEFRDKGGSDKYIRGKYLLWFFVQQALSLHSSIGKYCSKYTSPPKARVSLGTSNALLILGPRVRMPDSLRTFIDQNYLQYIRASV